jgi:tRNA(Ile)-lysidine synthase
LQRVETALEAAVDLAAAQPPRTPFSSAGPVVLDAEAFFALPAEIAIRLLTRAVAKLGHEGRVQLGKLEALYEVLATAEAGSTRLRRTLAGAMVTLMKSALTVEAAPPRRRRYTSNHGKC